MCGSELGREGLELFEEAAVAVCLEEGGAMGREGVDRCGDVQGSDMAVMNQFVREVWERRSLA